MRIPSKLDASERAARSDPAKEATPKGAKSAAGSAAGAAPGVKATVSGEARSLAEKNSLDVARVEQLRELIQSGRFVIDYQLIAERILQSGG